MKIASIILVALVSLACVVWAGENDLPPKAADKAEGASPNTPESDRNSSPSKIERINANHILEFSLGRNARASAGGILGTGDNTVTAGDLTAISIGAHAEAAAGSVIGQGLNRVEAGDLTAVSAGTGAVGVAGGVNME